MPIFETPRLIARPLTLDDLPQLTEILSDPAVMEYSVRGVCDEQATREFIEWCLACYESHDIGPWALVDKGSSNLIGFCGVAPEVIDGTERISLGYRLAKSAWNKRLASEAAAASLKYVFEQKQFDSVIVIIEPSHLASIRVAERVGFKSFELTEFHDRPVRVYQMSREAWAI